MPCVCTFFFCYLCLYKIMLLVFIACHSTLSHFLSIPLWSKNSDVCTGPLAHLFAHSLALLTRSLARLLTHSRAPRKYMIGWLFLLFFFLFWAIVYSLPLQSPLYSSVGSTGICRSFLLLPLLLFPPPLPSPRLVLPRE